MASCRSQESADAIWMLRRVGLLTDELIRLAQKRLDMAAQKGVIHKNEAARRKSRLIARATAASS